MLRGSLALGVIRPVAYALAMRRPRAIHVLLALAVAGCAGEPRVPVGDPLEVVLRSPDATIAAGRAQVTVTTPDGSQENTVDLHAKPRDTVGAAALEALTLVRRAKGAEAYGGQEIRGASTMRYDVDLDNGHKRRIDVWIDVAFRVRRVQHAHYTVDFEFR